MQDHPSTPQDPATLAELRARYPAPWVIQYEAPLHIYSAELRSPDGSSLHYLCGHDTAELAARLETATALDADS